MNISNLIIKINWFDLNYLADMQNLEINWFDLNEVDDMQTLSTQYCEVLVDLKMAFLFIVGTYS